MRSAQDGNSPLEQQKVHQRALLCRKFLHSFIRSLRESRSAVIRLRQEEMSGQSINMAGSTCFCSHWQTIYMPYAHVFVGIQNSFIQMEQTIPRYLQIKLLRSFLQALPHPHSPIWRKYWVQSNLFNKTFFFFSPSLHLFIFLSFYPFRKSFISPQLYRCGILEKGFLFVFKIINKQIILFYLL